ncbi:hypothetical protein MFLAVUS_004959 [Mucor flavus]|uniref:Uncharacterized protein n=1 Tax=Mucor flavus TaxID=439312 RepID=A0ABP9YXE8_9FUNG
MQLMKHWVSLYNNLISTRRTTAKLMKFPTRASAKFQAIHKKIKALRDVHAQYEVNSITTLGRYSESASISLEKYRELVSENEEDDEEQKFAAEFDMTTYNQITDECVKRRTLLPSSITVKIDNLFDDILEYRFDKNANRILQYFGDQKSAKPDKTSDDYKLLHIVQQAVFNFKLWTKESDKVMGSYSENFAELMDILFEDENEVAIYDGETISQANRQWKTNGNVIENKV